MTEIAAILNPTVPKRSNVARDTDRVADPAAADATMRQIAKSFEASFLAEMLKHAGLGKMPEQFNGGPGEAAYSGFLVQEYAEKVADTGRIGIAEQVYQSMKAKAGMESETT